MQHYGSAVVLRIPEQPTPGHTVQYRQGLGSYWHVGQGRWLPLDTTGRVIEGMGSKDWFSVMSGGDVVVTAYEAVSRDRAADFGIFW